MNVNWKSCIRIGVTAFVLFLAVTYWSGFAALMGMMLHASMPLLLGCVIAYVVNILMDFYERRLFGRVRTPLKPGAKRALAMLLAFVTLAAALGALLLLIIPQLITCFQVLLKAIPETIGTLYAWLDERIHISAMLAERNMALPATSAEWEAAITKHAGTLVSGVGGAMGAVISAASSVLGGVVTLFMALIFTVYILSSKEKLASQFDRLFHRFLHDRITDRLEYLLGILNDCFRSYIVGQCVEAMILGGLCVLGMLLLKLPYAMMIGALVGVTALIPVAGAYIGAAIGAVMIFSVDPVQALIFLVFLIILQQLEGNLIYPRTVGSSLGLPALWVLAAVMIGGGVMGVLGMLLFVPLTATLYRLAGRACSQ